MSYSSLLIHTCDLVDHLVGDWLEQTESITSGVKCRIEYANKLVKSPSGEEVMSFASVFFLISQAMTQNTKVRIYDVDNPAIYSDHPIIRIEIPADSVAAHHKEVLVS